MSVSELINEIVSEWAYRVEDGMPNPKNPTHIKELGVVLSEMGLSHIKNVLIENLLTEKGKTPEAVKEEEGSFTNPILNKKVTYKSDKGEDKEGIVGNLLRQPKGSPARTAAEKVLPPEGSPERDELNKELGGGSESDKAEDGGEDAAAKEKEKQQQAQAMFDPKVDPAMAQRLDKEKEIQAQIAKDAEERNKEAEKEVEPETKTTDEFNPIPSQDVKSEIPQADPQTFGAASDIPDGIDNEDLQKFNTDISKVQQIVDDAKAKGEKAPNINLCQITVPGTNLYCDDNLGIPRAEMPQFKGKPQPGTPAADMPVDKDGEVDTEPLFKKMLKDKGITVAQTEVPADKLKATQSELVGAKVVGMMGALEEDPNHEKITAPIYVSRDGYVIDGHHRWAAVAAYNAKHPEKQIPMKVQVIDQDIKDAIPMCNKFAEEQGVAAKKADANKETPTANEPKQLTQKEPEEVVNSLKNRKTAKGESLDVETTPNGSMIIGVEHGDGNESTKETISQIESLPKDTKVMFVGEGGMSKDSEGNLELSGEQAEIRDAVRKHFTNSNESSWDENANVLDDTSPVFDEVAKSIGGSKSKAKAAIWANMYGQDGPDENMQPDDYLDDEGKAWLIDQAKKGGSSEFDGDVDWNNLTDAQQEDLYQLNYRDDDGYGETEISKAQQAYNGFRQKELDRKIKEAEAEGYKVIAPVGNSHVDMWRQRNKSTNTSTDTSTKSTSGEQPKKVTSLAGGLTQKIKDKISNWHKEEKEFFNKGYYKAGSEPRRTISQAIKDKAKGALDAIKHGAQHEIKEFKEAGIGVGKFFKGEKLNDHEKKAIKSVAFKVATTAIFGAAMGGLSHGAGAFAKHVAMEFVPHVVAETLLKGTARAAVFADASGEAEMEANMQKFIEMIAKGLEEMDISEEQMDAMIDSYNEKKQKPEMKQENLELADELMLEMIYGFIEEAKTASGKYAARSKESGKLVYFDTPEAQKDAVKAGTHEEPDTKQKTNEPVAGADLFKDKESQKRLGKEKDVIGKKEEPKKEQPKKSRVVDSFDAEQIKEIESQYVTIRQAASDEMKEYSKDEYSAKEMPAGYTDDEYYSPKRKTSTVVRKQPYKFDNNTRAQLKASGFPTKYAQFIERCINTKVKGKKPPVTELIDQGGAGQIQSQFGEVMAMALMSVRDPQQRAQLAQILKSEIEKSNKEFGGSAIATTEWIDASLSHAESFDSSMDEKYGKGMWKFDGAAWDIKNDIEGLGLDYKNKGFSTDVMLRVQPLDKKGNPNGPARAQRCSLKKDENIMFFNGSIGEVENFILNYTSEDSRKKIRMYEGLLSKSNSKNPEEKAKAIEAIKRLTGQASVKAAADTLKAGIKELRDEAYNAAPKEVQDVVNRTRNFMNDQLKSAVDLAQYASVPMKPKELQDAVNSEFKDSGDREYAVMAYKFAQSCAKENGEVTSDCLRNKLKEAGEEAGTDRVSKLCVFLARTAKAAGYDVEDQLKAHYNIGKKLGSDLMKVIPKSKEMLGGVMQKLAEAFPMKVCMDGEEFMLIDGIKVTNKTLNTVFGVGSYDDLQKGMDVVELPNGDTILVYKAAAGGKQIPIGFVRGRQKGLGYESSVGFEIQCSDDFAYACSVANKDNGDESNGNSEAIKRIGGRIEKRNKKKK